MCVGNGPTSSRPNPGSCSRRNQSRPSTRPRFPRQLSRSLGERSFHNVLRNWVNQLLGPTTKDEIRQQACAIAEAQTPADLTNGVRVFFTPAPMPKTQRPIGKNRSLFQVANMTARASTSLAYNNPIPPNNRSRQDAPAQAAIADSARLRPLYELGATNSLQCDPDRSGKIMYHRTALLRKDYELCRLDRLRRRFLSAQPSCVGIHIECRP